MQYCKYFIYIYNTVKINAHIIFIHSDVFMILLVKKTTQNIYIYAILQLDCNNKNDNNKLDLD
jgi:hypothetical protein